MSTQDKLYALDLDKIARGEDRRTTLMIKNIPNKYSQKMLLAAVDEAHRGTYDFFYLPIDFKNKCNVGYAFINMIAVSSSNVIVINSSTSSSNKGNSVCMHGYHKTRTLSRAGSVAIAVVVCYVCTVSEVQV